MGCALAWICTFAPAGWAGTPGLVVIPRPTAEPGLSYFKLQARPGSVQRAGAVELRNPTAARLRVVLAPVDGETLSTLGSSYGPPGSRASGAALWLGVGSHSVTLEPGQSVLVPVAIAVPSGSNPGDYLSGISIEALDQHVHSASHKGVSIASVVRYAIGVEVSLPGPRHPLIQFTGAGLERQPSGLVFQLHARNSGNVILKGVHGYVRVTREGRTVVSRAIEGGTFVAKTSISYPVTAFHEVASEGTGYRIVAWLSYPGGIARLDTGVTFGHRAALIQQQYGGAPPSHGSSLWKSALVGGAVLYGLVTTFLLWRRRKPREEAARAQAGAAAERFHPDTE
jgi:hypothetical protein